ncbi:hypothetical protein K525DRAFT_275340 [Schizophyllum commune Loenen D]|nr:hypothetical protein K525DRAFT_275340 [Schizophyllum commune Loenen D]
MLLRKYGSPHAQSSTRRVVITASDSIGCDEYSNDVAPPEERTSSSQSHTCKNQPPDCSLFTDSPNTCTSIHPLYHLESPVNTLRWLASIFVVLSGFARSMAFSGRRRAVLGSRSLKLFLSGQSNSRVLSSSASSPSPSAGLSLDFNDPIIPLSTRLRPRCQHALYLKLYTLAPTTPTR